MRNITAWTQSIRGVQHYVRRETVHLGAHSNAGEELLKGLDNILVHWNTLNSDLGERLRRKGPPLGKEMGSRKGYVYWGEPRKESKNCLKCVTEIKT